MVELFNLVGLQTTHCVNSIAIQPGKFGCLPTKRVPRKKRCQHSLEEQTELHLKEYYIGKRMRPT